MRAAPAILLLLVFFAGACVPPPGYRKNTRTSWSRRVPGKNGDRIVITARRYLGVPYRYGGTTPRGFDCSGFVYYVYNKSGMPVKRALKEQFRGGRKVPRRRVKPGDLVFFQTSRRSISHVGIYAGRGRFIHAPRTGKNVSYARLDNPYWKRRYRGAVSYLGSPRQRGGSKRPFWQKPRRNEPRGFTEEVHYF